MGQVFRSSKHSHEVCIKRAKSRATGLAESTGKKFGANQLLVLDILLQDHKAISAYEIVERIAGIADRIQPVQVYRALDVLLKLGLVHRLESKNAYVACSDHEKCETPQFLHCSSCEQVAELPGEALSKMIAEFAQQNHFKLDHCLIEMVGLCPECTPA